jgi:F-type H+-transporting ATPase subunit delta
MMTPPVARRYARALLDIGVERGNLALLQEQFKALGELYKNSREFRNTMLNPSIKLDDRKAVVRKIAEKYTLDKVVLNASLLLLDRDRLRFIESISSELDRLSDLHNGRLRASVTSATALSAAQLEKLRQTLEARTGKKVELESSVDASLIGGLVTRLDGKVVDGSVRGQLERMRASFLAEL